MRSRNLKEVNEALRKRRRIREELMAQNAANGMGLLMLAVTMDDVNMLEYVTCELKTRVSSSFQCCRCVPRLVVGLCTSACFSVVL